MTSFDKEQVFEIVNIAKEAMEQRESGFFPALIKHQEEDAKRFDEITKTLESQNHTLEQILNNQKIESAFRTDLEALSDFLKGLGLLRKPMGWLVMFVLGLVALMGGFKTIIGWFVIKQ